MANEQDSFINEVTEDLRRDRLFALFRRYGWIAILLIVAIVAGTSWREYSLAKQRGADQAFGDAIIAAQGADDQAQALAGIDAGGAKTKEALTDIMQANALVEAGDMTGAAEALRAAAAAAEGQDQVLRDLALIKLVLVQGDAMDPVERDQMLADLAQAGRPFELLALEQQAVALIGAGRDEDAMTLIRQIQQKDGLSQPLRRRLSEMMIALGVEPDMTDTTPASE